MTSFDVLVIGSGPSGCAAAATCLKAGLHVVIVTENIDHTQGERVDPAPLESIHPGVSSLLNKIGLAGAEENAVLAWYIGIQAGQNYSPLGEDATDIWKGMHIHRPLFNHQLLQQTLLLGASVRFGEKVEDLLLEKGKVIGVRTNNGELFAKYVIDASGSKAIGGKKLKYKRRFYSPPLVCWTGLSGPIDNFHIDPAIAHFIPGDGGWTWLAPQPPHACSWTRLSVKGEKTFLPPDELMEIPVIGKVIIGNMRWRMFRPLCSEGVLLCGDAGGILDPAAGQGIFNALWSGLVAANAVVACIQQPAFANFHLATYDDWFVQQFEMKVKQLKEYYEQNGLNI